MDGTAYGGRRGRGAFSGLTKSYQPDVTFLAAWQAGLLMVAYGVVFAVVGTTLAVRRDVT